MAKGTSRAIMLQGTGSDVGKTVLVAGLCRLARQKGLSVRPFKPQNMSNNAAVADMPLADGSGGEIGRAQYLQAMACGVPSSVDMNPVLLKPQSEVGSQIVVHGKVWGAAKGRDYQKLKPQLLGAVLESFERLRADADLVIVEGAGSPAEINLRAGDIANMGFATAADVPVVLVGDIDRGGVIASIVGTHTILPDEDRRMIRGYLINKFRGDVSLFDDGLTQIEQFTGWPSFGVIPWLDEARLLPAEDSVALEHAVSGQGREGAMVVAVPTLSRISNFDDLDPLKIEPNVDVRFVRAGDDWPREARLVVLPGSKSTIADLNQFKALGWDRELLNHVERGGHVLGICGGYQMLGRTVRDPLGIEGSEREAAGIGLLNVDTELSKAKTVRNRQAVDAASGEALSGYEIHLGETSGEDCVRPMVRFNGEPDGAISADGRVKGCYLHGLFTSDRWRRDYLASLGVKSGGRAYLDTVDETLDLVAQRLEKLVDPGIFEL
ncbi:cobyric acid synthase [Pseudahrensia aquimaris]|uniref:Cobyric acid synthase n=1 Tax=Pseudahrensia aquimaris TaxID=744461 RepID=A0ABW3FLJ3_9HYPH